MRSLRRIAVLFAVVGVAGCDWGADSFGIVSGAPSGTYTQMDITHYTGCAVSATGGISCWGWGDLGQASPPGLPSGLTYTRVSAGSTASCAIRSDGSIGCWGLLDPNITSNVPPGEFADISVGDDHACAVTTAGVLECWGTDLFGQVSNAPIAPAGRQFTKVSAGQVHSCALLDDGTVQCWGSNDDGQLNIPALPSGVVYTDIATSHFRAEPFQAPFHTCGVRSDGAITCWGANTIAQLDVPPLPSGTAYTAVSAGGGHSCAIRSDGAPVCWGSYSEGQASPPSGLNLTRDPDHCLYAERSG